MGKRRKESKSLADIISPEQEYMEIISATG